MPTLQQRRLLLAQQTAIVYLLGPFRFETAQAAPLASPYTEAGVPGSLTLVDSLSKLSVVGGALACATVTSPLTGDPGAWGAGLARTIGRALLGTFRSSINNQNAYLGWDDNAANSTTPENVYNLGGNGNFRWAVQQTLVNSGVAYAVSTDYDLAVVLRSTGAWYLRKVGGTWTLEYVGASGSTATVYPTVQTGSSSFGLDNLRVADLGGPWSTDYGIATQRLAGARAASDAFGHTPNALIEFTVTTLPSAGSIDVEFRRQDSSNKWIARVSTTGALSLIEVVAAGETSRASAAGVISNGHRVVVVADGSTIAGYSNNVSRWSYGSASNFQGAGSGLLGALGTGGAVSDIVAWPRTVTLPSGV